MADQDQVAYVQDELKKRDLNDGIRKYKGMLKDESDEQVLLKTEAEAALRGSELEYAQTLFDLATWKQLRYVAYTGLGVSSVGLAYVASRKDLLVDPYTIVAVGGMSAVVMLVVYLVLLAHTGQRQANNWNKAYFPAP